jgi:hypothetical protein
VKLRRYCWRAGLALELEEGEQCPECGAPSHKPIEDQERCGAFVPFDLPRGDELAGKGEPCLLLAGHAGEHRGALMRPDVHEVLRRLPPRLDAVARLGGALEVVLLGSGVYRLIKAKLPGELERVDVGIVKADAYALGPFVDGGEALGWKVYDLAAGLHLDTAVALSQWNNPATSSSLPEGRVVFPPRRDG